jgi:thiol:disulfide interchange protein
MKVYAAILGVTLVAATALADSVKWATDYDKALAQAKSEKKLVMVDVYTDWCGWCKKLDKDVYTKADVVALSKEFVCIKLNPEKDRKNGKLFKVDGYPAIIFTDAKGKELHRIGGYMAPEPFMAEMKKALAAANEGKEKGKEKAPKDKAGAKEATE